jgi:hypothetical protein
MLKPLVYAAMDTLFLQQICRQLNIEMVNDDIGSSEVVTAPK